MHIARPPLNAYSSTVARISEGVRRNRARPNEFCSPCTHPSISLTIAFIHHKPASSHRCTQGFSPKLIFFFFFFSYPSLFFFPSLSSHSCFLCGSCQRFERNSCSNEGKKEGKRKKKKKLELYAVCRLCSCYRIAS